MSVVTPGHSPFHANYNNPVMFTDPLGLCPECPRDKRYYDARDNFMDYEPTSYVSPNLNGNSWVHSIGRNSRVYERYQMWSNARTLGLDEYVQKYGEAYANMNAYWRYYQEEQIANGVQVKRPELIISGGVNGGYKAIFRENSPQVLHAGVGPGSDTWNTISNINNGVGFVVGGASHALGRKLDARLAYEFTEAKYKGWKSQPAKVPSTRFGRINGLSTLVVTKR
ncbi:MAG: hypothetical protein AAGI25_20590 [Bacteroidota bacterium]